MSMNQGLTLSKKQCPKTLVEQGRMSGIPYALAIGTIMQCTRPDVSFALSVTSCFQRNPVECHWTAVISILEYLGRTKDEILDYGGINV